jgi:hypothetical protein
VCKEKGGNWYWAPGVAGGGGAEWAMTFFSTGHMVNTSSDMQRPGVCFKLKTTVVGPPDYTDAPLWSGALGGSTKLTSVVRTGMADASGAAGGG